ncbi:MAG: hypothetical protein AAF990_04405 [Bacteroidota bacterium]
MKDAQLFEKVILWSKRKGFNNIKANTEGYETPSALKKPDGEVYIPDLTGNQLGGKSYIEIALKEENSIDLVSKWKLYSTLAARKDGKLYLLAPKGHKAFTDKLVEKYNISATVVSI